MTEKINYNGFNLEKDDITILTFNQPKINIFSTEVLNDFYKALNVIFMSKDIKVLVIRSEGKHFIAGADIKEMAGFSPIDASQFSKLFHRSMNLLEELPKPVIAAVNGFALGGGCELILACDIVIASESAVFSQPEIDLGIIPGAGGTQRLKERIGKIKAIELILTGRQVNADEAVSLGLVNKVVHKDNLFEEVMELARVIASKPLQCLKACKTLINSGSKDKEIEEFSKLFSFDDQKRLMGKFVKK